MSEDVKLIEEAYGEVLNEMMPFVSGEGGFGGDADDKYETGNADKFKAFGSKYSGAGGVSDREDFSEILQSIINSVGKDILAAIADEDGRIEDNKREAGKRAGEILFQKSGGVFGKTHSQHLGRNVVDALLRADIIREVDSARGKSGGAKEKKGLTSDFSGF